MTEKIASPDLWTFCSKGNPQLTLWAPRVQVKFTFSGSDLETHVFRWRYEPLGRCSKAASSCVSYDAYLLLQSYVHRDIHGYTCIYIYIYIYMLAPPPKNYRTNPPTLRLLAYGPGLELGFEVPRRQCTYIGRSLHSQVLRPFTQILRMLSPKVAFTVASDQSSSNTHE